MGTENKEQKTKPGERKSGYFGGGVVWLFVLMAVAILVVVTYSSTTASVKIGFSDLEKLIVATGSAEKAAADGAKGDSAKAESAKSESGKGKIRITVGTPPKDVEYSGLKDVIIETHRVTGSVVRRIVDQNADERVNFYANKVAGDESDSKLLSLLSANRIDYDVAEGPSIWKSYLPMFVVTALFVLVIFLMMRRLGGAGSPMAFGRSRGKMYAQEDLGITFEDVAGIDEAVEELREVVEFLKTPEKYQTLGGRIPKGVLLVGPPGTGKTLLAKAIAGEAGVPFFSLSGSDFVEMFVGVGAARVRDMFQQAEVKAPCIIFIDELDALGKTRGTSVVGGHDEREQTLNALLVEMDGFDSNSGVIVLAATNRPETLDPALLRPGRFDRHVLVDRPDVRGREAILKVHVQNVKLDGEVTLKEVASLTSGFVGADLANLVNEAALLAARKGKGNVGMQEFNEGVERVTAGLEKKKRVIHLEEKQRVAYHESGHALVAYCLPNTDPVHKVSIIPRGLAALGYTMQRPEDDRYLLTQSELESRIQVLLAGTITEEIVFDDISTGAQNDLERASEIARSMVMDYGMSRLGRVNYRESNRSPFLTGGGNEFGRERGYSEHTCREIDEEVKRIVDESIEKVRDILESRRASLELLAQRLMEREVIDSSELKEIMEETSTSPAIVPGTTADRKRPLVIEPPEPRQADISEV
jgi:cell division protease FtsH